MTPHYLNTLWGGGSFPYTQRYRDETDIDMKKTLILGTRRSQLALAQSEYIRDRLVRAHPGLSVSFRPIITEGDKSQTVDVPLPPTGLKGLWTFEMEQLLESGDIDIAVHSLKDVPTLMGQQFVIAAIPEREDRADVLISRDNVSFFDLPPGVTVGTSSLRRGAQILRARPDLRVEVIRGNVDTRLKKLDDHRGTFAAIVLAAAGLSRLGLSGRITEYFSEEVMVPSAGQGALAVQCLREREEVVRLLAPIHHSPTGIETTAERAFTDGLGAGCNAAVGASARVLEGGLLSIVTRCLSNDGSSVIDFSETAPVGDAERLGRELAARVVGREDGVHLIAASHG